MKERGTRFVNDGVGFVSDVSAHCQQKHCMCRLQLETRLTKHAVLPVLLTTAGDQDDEVCSLACCVAGTAALPSVWDNEKDIFLPEMQEDIHDGRRLATTRRTTPRLLPL